MRCFFDKLCCFDMICSQNGKFSYGYASSPGKRSSMEDFYETRIDGVDGEVVGLFGVFDGIFTFFYLHLFLSMLLILGGANLRDWL